MIFWVIAINNNYLKFKISNMKTINEAFDCIWCGKKIPPAKKTCRNHCPYCFTSLHVDGDVPWDRDTNCHGIMKPVELDFKMSGGSKILFQCITCCKQHRNKVADDDKLDKLRIEIL